MPLRTVYPGISADIDQAATTRDQTIAVVKFQNLSEVVPPRKVGQRPPQRLIGRELYTFGAPAVSLTPLHNELTPDGCFPGIRIATASFTMVGTKVYLQHDPVPSLLDFIYKHPLMDYASVNLDVDYPNAIDTCAYFRANEARLKDTPKWDGLWWVDGHMEYPSITLAHADRYPETPVIKYDPVDLPPVNEIASDTGPFPGKVAFGRRLKQLGDDATPNFRGMSKPQTFGRAAMMAELGFLNYLTSGQIGIGAWVMGWRMIARSNAITHIGAVSGVMGMGEDGSDDFVAGSKAAEVWWTGNDFTDGFGDHLLLVQHPDTLECAMIWEGSGLHDIKDWLANLNFGSVDFCGFGHVHRGFRAKMLRMIGGVDYRQGVFRAAKSCSAMTIVGHSLGGAQADLFTACANRNLEKGQDGFLDHRLVRLPKASPAHARTFHTDRVAGSYLRNKGTNLCIDVVGTMLMEYRRRVIMYHCELPESPYSHDQRWVTTPDGFIKSELSGLCVHGNVSGELTQMPCLPAPAPEQQWKFTPERLWINKASGQCVDGDLKLGGCPYTDQRFELETSGLLAQKSSGYCIHVKAWGGVADGSPLVLWPCLQTEGTYQHWEHLENGVLRNKVSGKCAVPSITQDTLQTPPLVLGSCDPSVAPAFEFVEGGFIKDKKTMRCIDVQGVSNMEQGSPVALGLCEDKNIISNGLWLPKEDRFIISVGAEHRQMFKCLEIFGRPWHEEDKDASGAKLWLDVCETNTDQKWEITPSGSIVNVIGSPKCLAFASRNPHAPMGAEPYHLWIDNCMNPDDPSLFLEMKFLRKPNGAIENRLSGKCLVQEDGDPNAVGSYAEPTVWPRACSKPDAWDFGPNGTIVRRADGNCLDVGGPDFAEHPPLTTRACDGSASQQWALSRPGLLRSPAKDMCVGIAVDKYTDMGMGLFLDTCPSNKEQAWDMLPTGQIRHKGSNKCLDAPHSGQDLEFYDLTSWDCDESRKEQQWERIPAPIVHAY